MGALDARPCARAGCGRVFTPQAASYRYCSTVCATLAFYARHGLRPVTPAMMAAIETGADVDEAAAAARDARYGPLREVVKVLSETRSTKRVVLSCQHKLVIPRGAARGRCRQCLNPSPTRRKS